MKKSIKKSAAAILLGGFVMCGGICASAKDISVYVDSRHTRFTDANGKTVEPFIRNGTTYAPLRGVSQALGCEVAWDENNRTIYIYDESVPSGNLNKNSTHDIKIYIDGEETEMKDVKGTVVKPFIIDGTTYVPLRGISTALDCQVEWDGKEQKINIYKNTISPNGATLDFVRPYEYNRVELHYASEGSEIEMDGKKYTNALESTSYKEKYALFKLDGKYDSMTMTVGHYYCRFEEEKTLTFIVDGQIVETYTLVPNSASEEISVPLNRGMQLKITLDCGSALGNIVFK